MTFYGQRTSMSVSGQLSFPQGDYKSTFPVTGYGLRINVMHKPKLDLPLSIGGDLGFMVTGNSSRLFDIYYYGFYELFRVTATNNVISLAFKARADLIPADKPVQLFVDGTVGTNLYFSSVDITRETYYGQNDFGGGNSSKGYWSFLFGPGVGVEVALNKRKDAHLLLKGSYQFGSSTKYLTDPYIDNNGDAYFTQRESKTDMIITELGIRFALGRR
jgi:hypothetical protein